MSDKPDPLPERVVTRGGVTTITIEPGRRVLCDDCGGEYTDLKDEGGIYFRSYALCPVCAPKWERDAAKYGETHFIRARCPKGKSYADWVRDDLRRKP